MEGKQWPFIVVAPGNSHLDDGTPHLMKRVCTVHSRDSRQYHYTLPTEYVVNKNRPAQPSCFIERAKHSDAFEQNKLNRGMRNKRK